MKPSSSKGRNPGKSVKTESSSPIKQESSESPSSIVPFAGHAPILINNRHEAKFTSKIAEKISAQVANRSCYLNVAKYPVGVESRVQDMLELLDVEESNARMVGMWGIGGIGKTTIAKAIFNSIRHKFEGWCFLANVREASARYQGLVGLQNDLLYQISGGQKMEMTDVDRGIEVIKGRLGSKKVLLVLDDVNELNQLDKLARGLDWFGRGSRIIITTRDKDLLICHRVNAIYTAEALDNDEARSLLTLNAFKENINPDVFEKFPIDTALLYAHGLPLAINILGSLLCGKSIKQWHDTIDHFNRCPNENIQKVLATSYNALEDPLKEAFLDIACFLNGKFEDYVMQALDGSDLNPIHAIEVLEVNALISTQFGKIWMHDLLEEMGRDIVRKESPEDAGRRSRLWSHEDVSCVLTENTGSSKVKGIRVELPTEDEICLSAKCFKKMKNLRLFININARFSGEVYYLPNKLRFLDWPGFPAQSLPSNFNPEKLIKLTMPNSRISRLGQGLMNFRNLKDLSFESCEFLTEFSGMFPNLEKLNLKCCTSLAELHPSVGSLDKLVRCDLEGCENLKMFPRIVNMKSLKDLNFEGCKRLENFPEFEGRMESLKCINLSGTAIKEVPSSIGYHLFNLEELWLKQCENLMNLPPITSELKRLGHLYLTGCRNLVLTPFPKKVKDSEVQTSASNSNISHHGHTISEERESDNDDGDDAEGNLGLPSLFYLSAAGCSNSDIDVLVNTLCHPSIIKVLDLSESNFVSLPACLTKLVNLDRLDLGGCKRLQEVPVLPPKLRRLCVGGCESLESIWKLSSNIKRQGWEMFEWLDLSNCSKLCDNLVQEAEKKGLFVSDDHQVEADLFSLFLSSQKYLGFAVVFPASYEVPKWFTCQMDFERSRLFEFDIEVLPNFEWHNTGLALSVTTRQERIYWEFEVHINDVLVWNQFDVFCWRTGKIYEADSARVWLQYIPFNIMNMFRFGYRPPRPPFKCRVTIYQTLEMYPVPLTSCGLHLVMPPHEECMKLSQTLRIDSLDGNLHESQSIESFFEIFAPRGFVSELTSSDEPDYELESSDDFVDELESSDYDPTRQTAQENN